MLQFLATYGLFLAEAATIVIAILALLAGIIAITSRGKSKAKIEINKLNEKYDELKNTLQEEILSKEEQKTIAKKVKEQKQLEKQRNKQNKKPSRKRMFVVDFDGDMRATQVDNLREAITAILTIATPADEILIKIESPGGVIHGYGLAASQLKRIRDRGIPLTVSVDKVAASGGYMMACVANKIIAAPFAILGSIGVVFQMPNFHRLLKKHDIEFEQLTAGEYKRTLTLFGENTSKGREKMQDEIDEAHTLFKDFIAANRPIVDIKTIATGEPWYGVRAREIRLIDDLISSDDYLMFASEKCDIYEINYVIKKSFMEKLGINIKTAWLNMLNAI
jgi:serine protease SohB